MLFQSWFQKTPRERKKDSSRRIHSDVLEQRCLLTGSVSVIARSGNIVVAGDTADNQIEITQIANDRFRISGLEGTKVNGSNSAVLNGKGFNVQMEQGGSDLVAFREKMTVNGNVNVAMGDEGQFVVDGHLKPVRFNGSLSVETGEAGSINVRDDVKVSGATRLDSDGAVTVAGSKAMVPNFEAARFSDPLTIDNPCFPLVVGTEWTYDETIVDEAGEVHHETIVTKVLNETKVVNGVTTRVIIDSATVDGRLMEETRDWYAQDDNGNVWYFGEVVKNFEYDANGNLIGTNTHGSFEAGVNGDRAGVIMLANPTVVQRYYQEVSFENAVDQGEILETNETQTVPAGRFDHLLQTRDFTILHLPDFEEKYYAPGLGIVRNVSVDPHTGEVLRSADLVSVTLNGVPVRELVPTTGFSGVNPTGTIAPGPVFVSRASIEAQDTVSVYDATFQGPVTIDSTADIVLIESEFRGRTSIESPATISAQDSTFQQAVSIESNEDVVIDGSTFRSNLNIRFGAGNNTLTIGESSIRNLVADGGPGIDTFVDLGENTIQRKRLKSIRV